MYWSVSRAVLVTSVATQMINPQAATIRPARISQTTRAGRVGSMVLSVTGEAQVKASYRAVFQLFFEESSSRREELSVTQVGDQEYGRARPPKPPRLKSR